MFFLGCHLSDVTLANDLGWIVEDPELLDNIEWLFGLPGVKWICSGAVACSSLCTTLVAALLR